jgi:hypothetical protein
MKKNPALIIGFVALGLSTSNTTGTAQTESKPRKQTVVTAAQVNGTYRYYDNEFRILALGKGKLKVQFDGVYHTISKSVNTGYASGEAIIDGNIATFKPEDPERCEITLVFLPNKLKVEQDGSDADCGFGHNVNASGTYRKIRAGKPKFEEPPE